jgi:hypothetical protein
VKENVTERRILERFGLEASARLTVDSADGGKAQLDLTTKDVSSGGAFVRCQKQFVEGARVKMELLLSGETIGRLAGGKGRARIMVRGTIVRAEATGIAIRFDGRYRITALGEGFAEHGGY